MCGVKASFSPCAAHKHTHIHQVGADICLSATSFHQETWQPVWTVRTLVSALRSHMATKAVEVGGIEASAARRLVLAHRSVP